MRRMGLFILNEDQRENYVSLLPHAQIREIKSSLVIGLARGSSFEQAGLETKRTVSVSAQILHIRYAGLKRSDSPQNEMQPHKVESLQIHYDRSTQ